MNPSGPFVLSLHDLEEGETHLEMVGTGSDLELSRDELALSQPVVLRAKVFRAAYHVEVQGTLLTTADLVCDRCLEPIRRALEIPFRVFSERQETRDHRTRQEMREEDPGIVYHDGQFVVLTDEVRQELLVEKPWHVVCRPDCLGLCPRCGGNRNVSGCTCPDRRDQDSPDAERMDSKPRIESE